MKRHLVTAAIIVAVLVAGAFGYLGSHFSEFSRNVDSSLSEASYELRNEPIDPEWALTQTAKAVGPIAVFVAGLLIVLLIAVVVHGMKKQADRLPGARFRRRTREVATGGQRDSQRAQQ